MGDYPPLLHPHPHPGTWARRPRHGALGRLGHARRLPRALAFAAPPPYPAPSQRRPRRPSHAAPSQAPQGGRPAALRYPAPLVPVRDGRSSARKQIEKTIDLLAEENVNLANSMPRSSRPTTRASTASSTPASSSGGRTLLVECDEPHRVTNLSSSDEPSLPKVTQCMLTPPRPHSSHTGQPLRRQRAPPERPPTRALERSHGRWSVLMDAGAFSRTLERSRGWWSVLTDGAAPYERCLRWSVAVDDASTPRALPRRRSPSMSSLGLN